MFDDEFYFLPFYFFIFLFFIFYFYFFFIFLFLFFLSFKKSRFQKKFILYKKLKLIRYDQFNIKIFNIVTLNKQFREWLSDCPSKNYKK